MTTVIPHQTNRMTTVIPHQTNHTPSTYHITQGCTPTPNESRTPCTIHITQGCTPTPNETATPSTYHITQGCTPTPNEQSSVSHKIEPIIHYLIFYDPAHPPHFRSTNRVRRAGLPPLSAAHSFADRQPRKNLFQPKRPAGTDFALCLPVWLCWPPVLRFFFWGNPSPPAPGSAAGVPSRPVARLSAGFSASPVA